MRSAFLVPAVLFLYAPAFAQGSDDCATPTPIAGLGTFAYNNAAATQSPQAGTCATVINRDVWFVWTAPATDTFQIDSCGLATWDTQYAVYAGTACPTGPYISCNDDSCGLQSRLTFSATAGASYVFELGTYGSSAGGSGSFLITQGGPPGCSSSVGGDVILGEVYDIGNYGVTGALDAIAVGTDGCNIGTAPLGWSTSSLNHPVIAGHLYRYKVVDGAGRFEQIGLSWLKHGFAAANGSTCCPCQGGGGGLGPGCSDIYSSGLNGSQGSLGPRWQINAHTGAFPYPQANPSWSGTTARRCEFLITDAEATSGSTTRFFAEAQYVHPTDSAAGNQNNNASYRELSCTGSAANWTFAMMGGTQRQQSAIRAWAAVDPQVMLTEVQVPGDGLLVVGSRAYALGGGQHRFEYAVYNMNADRNAGTFSVPVPAGATISNVGFHGVVYRNGDGPGNVNVSSTPWTSAVSGGFLTWSTEPQAANPSANAIRWGTTYNFRFDADVAPADGSVAFGLWKPGTPDQMGAAARVPSPGGPSFALCFGDGTGTACPCGNSGASGRGCANSLGTGALLAGSGAVSVSGDTLVLAGSGMPNAACLYFQGSTALVAGLGTPFGDGLRCAGGTVVRLGTKTNVGGASQYPAGGDPAVSVAGGVVAGNARTYQVWYRNSAAFCTPDTFNLSNAWQVYWQP